jgi:hypothetical protein
MEAPHEENKPNVNEEQQAKPTVLGGLVDVFKTNIGDTVAYVLLTISLILCFFFPFFGGIPVGFIMGIYFSPHAFRLFAQFKDFLITDGIFRGFIIVASVVALAISAPGLVLGLIFGTFSRPLFGPSVDKEKPE